MSNGLITRREIVDFLLAIRSGAITLTPVTPPIISYPRWVASNGWHICVFDDAGEWDYIEWVETSDGRRASYSDIYLHDLSDNPIRDAHPRDNELEHFWKWQEATL